MGEAALQQGGEFFGEAGRHYHVRRLALPGAPEQLLVAEVSRELLVRLRIPGVLGMLGISLLVILLVTLALGYWLWPSRPLLARRLFWLGGSAGMLMGLGQMVRGAHFLSHNLWSGWLVWLACCLLFAGHDLLWQPWRQRIAARLAATAKPGLSKG